MSSARKRAYKHKAYAEIDHLKQQLALKTYHYDSMLAINEALAKAGDDAREERDRLRAALEKLACLGNGDAYGNSIGNCIAQEALKGTL